MSDHRTVLGQPPDIDAARDAVHVAVVPAVAAKALARGQHVGVEIGDDGAVSASSRFSPHIGIVDPFITDPVIDAGARFYLVLYPDTVTGMRHHWQHPAFTTGVAPPAAPAPTPTDTSTFDDTILIADIAAKCDVTVSRLLDVAREYAETDEHEFDNSETYKAVTEDEWRAFWAAFARKTGTPIPEWPHAPFTCSC